MKNAKNINELIIDPLGLSAMAQVGVDLTINKVSKMKDDQVTPSFFNDATAAETGVKAHFIDYVDISTEKITAGGKDIDVFKLSKGVYSIEMDQGLKALPSTQTAFIIQRSTFLRNGVEITSSVYDPGFETPAIGAIMFVPHDILIEQHSRVAQIVIHENEEAELYDGTYQGEKDFR